MQGLGETRQVGIGRVPVGHIATISVILLAGACLRLVGISERPIWVDEGFSVLYATIPWADVIELRRVGTNPPLYHFLLSLWVDAFGTSTFALRSLSALFGVGSVLVMYLLGRRLLGTAVGLHAAGLLAVSNLSVAHGQEARFYALTQFLSLVSCLALCALIDRRSWRNALTYAVSMSAMVWVHTFAWFVLAAQVVWLAAAAWRLPRAERRKLVGLGACAALAVVVSFLPWVPILRQQMQSVLTDYWISEPPWWALADCVRSMLVTGNRLRWLVGAIATVMLLRESWMLSRRTKNSTAWTTRPELGLRSDHCWGIIAWFVLPILVPFVWSKIGQPVFQVKYAIVAQAPALLLLAWWMARRPAIGWTGLAALCLLFPPNADRDLIVEDFPAAAALLVDEAAPDEPIFVYRDYAAFSLRYYFNEPQRLTPVVAKGRPIGPFARFHAAPPISYDQMIRRVGERLDARQWLVLRWGSLQQRQELYDELSRIRTVKLVGEFRCVDVACLLLKE